MLIHEPSLFQDLGLSFPIRLMFLVLRVRVYMVWGLGCEKGDSLSFEKWSRLQIGALDPIDPTCRWQGSG